MDNLKRKIEPNKTVIIIEELTEQNRMAWDAYVRNAPGGLPQHLSGWRNVLRKTYGYETHYLLAQTNGVEQASVIGVLPLFFVNSLLTGHRAMTIPGGLCANSAEIAQMLLAKGREIAEKASIKNLVIQDSRQPWPGAWQTSNQHVNWLMDVRAGEEAVWKRLDRNIRRQIRMARDHQLRVAIERTPRLLDDFYQVFSRFTHQSGTPVFGRNFLENLILEFPHNYNTVVIYKDQQPIGGYFQLEMEKTVYGMWGATLHEYLALRPVYLAYWEILADAIAHQFECLDMGRSPVGSNASAFKGQWGGVCIPIYQQTSDEEPTTANVAVQAQTDGRFRSFRQLWPKLPFAVAQFLGPKLRRHVPFA